MFSNKSTTASSSSKISHTLKSWFLRKIYLILLIKNLTKAASIISEREIFDLTHDNFLESLSQCVSLTYLDLGGNNLKCSADHSDHLFRTLVNLEHLDLSDMGLTYLDPNTFEANTNLIHLDLSDNHLIEELNANIFDVNTKLKYLSLHGNHVTLNSNIFEKFVALEHLNLSQMGLTFLDPNIFQTNTNLTELYLFRNKLSEFNPVLLEKNTQLKVLYLGANSLADLDPIIIKNLTHLEELDLMDAKLRTLDLSMFDNLLKLKILHLGTLFLINNVGLGDRLKILAG